MVRVGLLALMVAHSQGLEHLGQDKSLFLGPFYELLSGVEQSHAAAQFRDAYCQARHIADTEDFTKIFNTGVGDGPIYFTREEFTDGDSFNLHLNNVSEAFAHALEVARPTGFVATGTHRDLHAIRKSAKSNHMTTFLKDERSFKRQQFKGDDYFSLDFFLTMKHSDLDFFVRKWRETRDLAATKPYVLALVMGVRTYIEDGNITVHCQETYASAADYKAWLPEAAPFADAFFTVAEIASAPNPFSMFGADDQLALVRDHCNDLADGRGLCVQYTFDSCLDGDVVV